MKFSDAILRGYATNGGHQCVDRVERDDGAMCVIGAYRVGTGGTPHSERDGDECFDLESKWRDDFERAWGFDPVAINNNREERGPGGVPFPWEHIYGMARAIGI